MSNTDFADFINQLFASLDTKDSIIILLFLLGAFLIGWIARWFFSRRKIRRLQKSIKDKEGQLITTRANYEALQEQFEIKEKELDSNREAMDELVTSARELEAEKAELQSDLYTTRDQLQALQSTNPLYTTEETVDENGNPIVSGTDASLLYTQLKDLRLERERLISLNEQLEAENESLQLELQTKGGGSNGGYPVFVDDERDADSQTGVGTNDFQTLFRRQANQLTLIESKLRHLESENDILNKKIQFLHQDDPDAMSVLIEEEEEEEVIESASDLKSIKARQAVSAALGTKMSRASESDKDDLKKINGIGPFIEEQLNSIGIYTFRQISQFDDDLIEQVTDAIQFFPGRIKRDDWVGQARRLARV